MSEKRIAWAITGAGQFLEECVDTALNYDRLDVFLSKAAEEVMLTYHLDERLSVPKVRIYQETKYSAPQVIRLFAGEYRVLVVAPATSNSVAKFVCGISDTLVTNLFAQAGKSRVPVIVYPTDLASEMDSYGPNRQQFKVYPRPVDLENTNRLKSFPGVTVVSSQEDLERCLAGLLKL
jgi:flavoprotein